MPKNQDKRYTHQSEFFGVFFFFNFAHFPLERYSNLDK